MLLPLEYGFSVPWPQPITNLAPTGGGDQEGTFDRKKMWTFEFTPRTPYPVGGFQLSPTRFGMKKIDNVQFCGITPKAGEYKLLYDTTNSTLRIYNKFGDEIDSALSLLTMTHRIVVIGA